MPPRATPAGAPARAARSGSRRPSRRPAANRAADIEHRLDRLDRHVRPGKRSTSSWPAASGPAPPSSTRAARTRRPPCRRSAGRVRSRSGARRSRPSRSSGARRRTRSGRPPRVACSRLRTHWMPSMSRPLTGSSNITVVGSPSSADAIPSRWPMPSEKPPARLRATRARPTISISSLHPGATDRHASARARAGGCTRNGRCGPTAPRAARRPRAAAPRGRGTACR